MYNKKLSSREVAPVSAYLQQSVVVAKVVLSLAAGVLYLVAPAGQHQLVGIEERCWVDGGAIDQAHQVLAVVLPVEEMETMFCIFKCLMFNVQC